MQIRTTKLGEYIAKLLATKPTVEIYEVEEWGCDPFSTYSTDSYSEYFTTLEEAKEHFDVVAFYTTERVVYGNINKNSLATYYNEGCTLRKVRFDLLDENSKTLDRNIEQTIKEKVVTVTKYN